MPDRGPSDHVPARRLFALRGFVLTLSLCVVSWLGGPTVATAQPDGTWVHRFEDHTVYLQIRLPMLSVWRIDDRGECMMMPSTVRWKDEALLHSAGTRWDLTRNGDTLTVALPDTTLDYTRTPTTPHEQCSSESKKI